MQRGPWPSSRVTGSLTSEAPAGRCPTEQAASGTGLPFTEGAGGGGHCVIQVPGTGQSRGSRPKGHPLGRPLHHPPAVGVSSSGRSPGRVARSPERKTAGAGVPPSRPPSASQRRVSGQLVLSALFGSDEKPINTSLLASASGQAGGARGGRGRGKTDVAAGRPVALAVPCHPWESHGQPALGGHTCHTRKPTKRGFD